MTTSFDFRPWKIETRKGRKTSYRVRWVVARRHFSASFLTMALAESFRASLITAARKGKGFDTDSGLPESMERKRRDVTFYQHAAEFAAAAWPAAAAKTRVSIIETWPGSLWERGRRFVRYADDLRVFVQRTGCSEGVRERLRRDRTAAEAEGEPGEVLDPARRAGDVAGVRVSPVRPAGHDPGRPEGGRAAEGSAADLDRAELARADGVPHWQAEPVHYWLDGLFLARGRRTGVPQPGRMAAPPLAAGALEGMEDHRRQAAQPADTRYLREQRPEVGRQQQGVLAGCGSTILQVSLPNSYWNRLGLKALSQTWQRLNRTA